MEIRQIRVIRVLFQLAERLPLMFLGVFQRRVVVYLILIPLLLSTLMGVWWNLNLRF